MDSNIGFTDLSEMEREVIINYSYTETLFSAAREYFINPRNIFFRRHAVALISTLSKRLDPNTIIPYLAMNYFDRFLSMRSRILEDVEGIIDTEKVHLIAIACLTISAKMRMKDFSIDLFLKSNPKEVNERISHHMVMRTEVLILRELDWEMLPVTPFTFMNYYHRYFKDYGGFKRRCINEIIVQAQGEQAFVHYFPTVLTMSAFLAASKIAYPSMYREIAHPFTIPSVCPSDKVEACTQKMLDLCDRLNIQIETPVSGTPSTSKITETQQNRGKGVMIVDSSEEDGDEEEGTPLINLCWDRNETGSSSQVQVTQEIEEENRILASVEAIIRRPLEKGKPSVSEKMEEYTSEIAELEELKSLMIFEIKWPTDVPSTEPESETIKIPTLKQRTRKKLTCGGCNIG